MLERMKNVLKNRKADGDKGFSLVELAVVIVIIGILVAIAIPVFSGIQDGAKQAKAEAAAANGAAIVSSNIAKSGKATISHANASVDLDSLKDTTGDSVTITKPESPDDVSLDDFCVTAIIDNMTAKKGPGCTSA